MKNTVIRVLLLPILLQHFGVIGPPFQPKMTFQLTEKVAYFLINYKFFNSKMQDMEVPRKEIHWYYSKAMTADNCVYRNVFIKNKMKTSVEVSCSTSQGLQIGTLTLQPEYSYFFRFEDNFWNHDTYSCVATYSTTKKVSFDAYKGKAPIAYQNGFETREDGIYLIDGTSSKLYKKDAIMFLGIGSKLTKPLAGNNDYRVIQFENQNNRDVYLRCDANDGFGNEFTVGGREFTVPKKEVYKLAIEAGNFTKGFVECTVGVLNDIGFRELKFKAYGEDSFGQYKRGNEYYFINDVEMVTFEKIVNFELLESEIANKDPKKHLIQIENQMRRRIYVHCWGKQDQNSPQINVGMRDYYLPIGKVYTFSMSIDSFKKGEFWCDMGGIYPDSKHVKIYGYETASRSNHIYAMRDNIVLYEKLNGNFVLH